jgi:polyphenol oxidase
MVTSPLLSSIPGLRHGFGTATALVPEALAGVWQRRPIKRQVHGTRVAAIAEPQQEAGEADGFWTAEPGIPVSIITADCVPLLLARRDGKQVAAIHAGWRGLYDGIIAEAVSTLGSGSQVDTAPAVPAAELVSTGEPDPKVDTGSTVVAAVGPTICAACYEVSAEMADDFARRFGPAAVPAYRHLDLRAIAELQLRAAGVVDIEHVGGCTCCSRDAAGEPIYRSYRRGDRGSQMHSGLYITTKGEQ